MPQVVIDDEEIFPGDDLSSEFIVPSLLDPRVGAAVASAVAPAAAES